MTRRIRERGEGKVGCIVSLVVLGIAAAIGIKVVPVLYSDNALIDAAERKIEAGAGRSPEDLVKELREEARRLEIGEALAAGAIQISKKSSAEVGTISVTLRYSRKVDLYGVYVLNMDTNKRIDKPLLENIK